MKIYGLTGGIASGKSEASRKFAELGIPVLDADKIAHEVIEPGGIAAGAVVEAFGEGILTCGRIDREKLGGIVFADREALQRLNGLVHPAVGSEMNLRSAKLAEEGHSVALFDAALLAEDGKLRDGFAGLILVLCERDERMRRLVEFREMTETEAARRIDAQTPPEEKIPLAKWLIDNNGDIGDLHAQVEAIAKEL